MQWLVREKGMLDNLSVCFGNRHTCDFIYENADSRTLYDLASLSKLFTLIAVMKLRETGKLCLSSPLSSFDKRFRYIGDLTIDEIISYRINLVTRQRVDAAGDRSEAIARLFDTQATGHHGSRIYSDIHAMVLKYAVEGAAGTDFLTYLTQTILQPVRMVRTYARVPDRELPFTQSYDGEHRIEEGHYSVRHAVKGIPHDPKAALISPDGGDLCGHAGLFSSLDDMALLCQAMLSGELLSEESLRLIAENRTGKRLLSGDYTQYLGLLCFVKHPSQTFSEVPEYMTYASFGLSGFTGNHFSIDPVLGIFNVFLGNRCLNRLTVLSPLTHASLRAHHLSPDGTGTAPWPDGSSVLSSVQYVHQKDKRLHNPIRDTLLQRGMLSCEPY